MEYILNLFSQYEIIIIFLLVFLEHMNTPGLGAVIVLIAVGIIVAKGNINIFVAILICIIAGVLANFILYLVGRCFGKKILEFLKIKFPKVKKYIEGSKISSKNIYGRISCRFLPCIRTIIPLIEGGIGVNIKDMLGSAIIGVGIYNTLFISCGYVFAKII